MKKLLLVLFFIVPALMLTAQNRTITGRVTDENGKPVPEVTVAVKETLTAVTTDNDGSFSISVGAAGRTLIFSYIGKTSEEVSIGNRTIINTVLKSEEKALTEVVVVGYGSQSRKKITGAINKIGGEEFENKPFTSVDQMLQGKVPGLFSTASSGQPGSAQNVLIRGVGSITAGSAPLYVVDGIPINTGDFSRLAPAGTTNTLAGINPNDIESVSVLKDAASSSIYGSRAANGVILITTKKGKAGKSKIRVDSELGFGSVASLSDQIKPLNRNILI
jgi:TonB-dependent starch-binding outer membrane protein SusC